MCGSEVCSVCALIDIKAIVAERLRKQQEEELLNSYTVKLNCRNCGFNQDRQIPRGKLVTSSKCINCGCATLTRANNFTL